VPSGGLQLACAPQPQSLAAPIRQERGVQTYRSLNLVEYCFKQALKLETIRDGVRVSAQLLPHCSVLSGRTLPAWIIICLSHTQYQNLIASHVCGGSCNDWAIIFFRTGRYPTHEMANKIQHIYEHYLISRQQPRN